MKRCPGCGQRLIDDDEIRCEPCYDKLAERYRQEKEFEHFHPAETDN